MTEREGRILSSENISQEREARGEARREPDQTPSTGRH